MICFHNLEEENGYLSNWYLSDFIVDGMTFSSMEQYMMYQKACLFHDEEIAKSIMQTRDVAKIKALGRRVRHFDDEIWVKSREQIVYKGVLQKFYQNPEIQKRLLETGNDPIAECAVNDRIWGIGLSMTDENRFFESKWRGQNLLGKILMQVRNDLR